MEVVEPRFTVEFLEPTHEIMFTAIYPAGCTHRTSMTIDTLRELLAQASTAHFKATA